MTHGVGAITQESNNFSKAIILNPVTWGVLQEENRTP